MKRVLIVTFAGLAVAVSTTGGCASRTGCADGACGPDGCGVPINEAFSPAAVPTTTTFVDPVFPPSQESAPPISQGSGTR